MKQLNIRLTAAQLRDVVKGKSLTLDVQGGVDRITISLKNGETVGGRFGALLGTLADVLDKART